MSEYVSVLVRTLRDLHPEKLEFVNAKTVDWTLSEDDAYYGLRKMFPKQNER